MNLPTLTTGIRLFETPTCVIQFRFPRTKKRRIRKKWAARRENFRPDPNLYRIADGAFIGHPATIARLKASLR